MYILAFNLWCVNKGCKERKR